MYIALSFRFEYGDFSTLRLTRVKFTNEGFEELYRLICEICKDQGVDGTCFEWAQPDDTAPLSKDEKDMIDQAFNRWFDQTNGCPDYLIPKSVFPDNVGGPDDRTVL